MGELLESEIHTEQLMILDLTAFFFFFFFFCINELNSLTCAH
jgi:hypothetical protein